MSNNPYECVIFDFDGTLADTEELAFEIYNRLSSDYGYDQLTKEDMRHIKKMNLKQIVSHVNIPLTKLPKIARHGQKELKKEMGKVDLFSENDLEDIAAIRKRVRVLGIITSNSKRNVEAFLTNHGIDAFDFIVSSPLTGKEKKIQTIAKRYNIDKDRILYVGDETRDITASKKAGIDCACVSWGYNHVEALEKENPTYLVKSLKELRKILGEKEETDESTERCG